MAEVRPDEVSAILREQLSGARTEAELEEVGTVLQVGDGVARIYGLSKAQAGELLEFENGLKAMVLNLEEDNIGAVILAAKLGGREVRKYSGGVSGGRTTRNWQHVDEAWFKPLRMLALPAGMAVLKHPRRIGRPLLRRLPFTTFTRANEHTTLGADRN